MGPPLVSQAPSLSSSWVLSLRMICGVCSSCLRARSRSSACWAVRADRAELRALHHARAAPMMETARALMATRSAATAVGSVAASIQGG
jgi:hypothetical protein